MYFVGKAASPQKAAWMLAEAFRKGRLSLPPSLIEEGVTVFVSSDPLFTLLRAQHLALCVRAARPVRAKEGLSWPAHEYALCFGEEIPSIAALHEAEALAYAPLAPEGWVPLRAHAATSARAVEALPAPFRNGEFQRPGMLALAKDLPQRAWGPPEAPIRPVTVPWALENLPLGQVRRLYIAPTPELWRAAFEPYTALWPLAVQNAFLAMLMLSPSLAEQLPPVDPDEEETIKVAFEAFWDLVQRSRTPPIPLSTQYPPDEEDVARATNGPEAARFRPWVERQAPGLLGKLRNAVAPDDLRAPRLLFQPWMYQFVTAEDDSGRIVIEPPEVWGNEPLWREGNYALGGAANIPAACCEAEARALMAVSPWAALVRGVPADTGLFATETTGKPERLSFQHIVNGGGPVELVHFVGRQGYALPWAFQRRGGELVLVIAIGDGGNITGLWKRLHKSGWDWGVLGSLNGLLGALPASVRRRIPWKAGEYPFQRALTNAPEQIPDVDAVIAALRGALGEGR